MGLYADSQPADSLASDQELLDEVVRRQSAVMPGVVEAWDAPSLWCRTPRRKCLPVSVCCQELGEGCFQPMEVAGIDR
jgi:hypothetical protein